MGFKDFCNNNDVSVSAYDSQTEEKAKHIEGLYNQYKDKSNDELMQELYKIIQSQKVNGTFNYDELSKMLDQFSAVFPEEQINNMKNVLRNFI